MSGKAMRFAAAAVAVTASLFLGACTTNPATGRQSLTLLSSQDEAQMGADEHPKIIKAFGGVYDDPELNAYVAQVGAALARNSDVPNLNFTFTVLNSPIVNAMALPGGYVYVTRGLLALANDEAELAGVMAHEIGHVAAHHTNERVSQQLVTSLALGVLGVVTGSNALGSVAQYGAEAYLQSYSRDQESEADTLGVRTLARAGYAPSAMASFLTSLRLNSEVEAEESGRPSGAVDKFDIMATHPRTLDRIQAATEAALKSIPTGQELGRDRYLQHIEGLLYDGDPEQGFVFGREFIHPKLGFRFLVPAGFVIHNSPTSVVARNPAGAMIVFDQRPGGGDMVDYLQRRWARNARLADVEGLTVNGLAAATGTTRTDSSQGTVDVRLVAIDGGDGVISRFLFITPPKLTDSLAEELKSTTYSFLKLSPEQQKRVQPLRIHVVTVKPGDTQVGLAAQMPFDQLKLEHFQALNGLQPGQQLQPGQKVKVIR